MFCCDLGLTLQSNHEAVPFGLPHWRANVVLLSSEMCTAVSRLRFDLGGCIDEEHIIALVIILRPFQLDVVEVWQLVFARLLDGILQHTSVTVRPSFTHNDFW